MIDSPEVVGTAARQAAVIYMNIRREEIQSAMGPAFGELFGTLSAQGVTPTGPAFSHHLRMLPGMFEFELGVPVDKPVTAAGRVRPGELPAATVVRTTMRGNYDQLGPAWAELQRWIKSAGHTPRQDFWESYVTGPESSQRPDEWRTELNQPIEA